ncbi:hypothetical protein [Adlercreutzia mucosicola]|uniref:hypothetical protein n=1 Tax=Adlercreutzia mucosicola TaxID=580026 RepID=UPI000418C2B0|nr:hypothetical protein [Adlercreutzia mucosicola]MCR2036156.1 hypothetical protein [Adlercreutzia mucosicola]
MPRTRKEARLECLAGLPRPTVSDREAADKIVADAALGSALAAAFLGLPALCGLVYQAVVLP